MTAVEARARDHLRARRDQLAELVRSGRDERLLDLMRRVDAALGAIEVGSWGVCTGCREPIEVDLLDCDPLACLCLDCLPEEDRRALERDLRAASRVQRALLPAQPIEDSDWEVAYLWEPRGAVSGDHVDLLRPRQPGGALDLLLGDVAGKGVAASLLQSHLHALFRALAPARLPLAELLGQANRLFAEATAAASYATLVAVRLEPTGQAEIVNAGHPRPLLGDRRGVRPIEGADLPLGLFRESSFVGRALVLAPGDTLLAYSDGWTEADREGEEYGIGRAAAAFRRGLGAPLADLLATCKQELDDFLQGSPRGDDLSLLAIRRRA